MMLWGFAGLLGIAALYLLLPGLYYWAVRHDRTLLYWGGVFLLIALIFAVGAIVTRSQP